MRRANASLSLLHLISRKARAEASPEEIRTTCAKIWDPDADYYPARKFPEAQPYHGLDEITEFLVRFREMWSRFEWTVHEVIDVGDERALSHMTLEAEGRGSGVRLEGDIYQAYWFRHGRLLRVEDHLTLKGALHALGLKGDTLEAAGLRAPSNIDLARSIFAAWEQGDFTEAEWAHPEIEYVFADGPSPGTWKGLAGMSEAWGSFLKAWEQFHPDVEELRELDDERILALYSFKGRGKTSGLDLGQMRAKGAGLLHIENGKVTRAVFYLNRDRAFAELGLPSEARASS